MAWPRGSAPELPWAVYYLEAGTGFCADDVLYAPHSAWVVELYQRSRDAEAERRIEDALMALAGAYSKTEAWVESESCLQTTYRFHTID